MHDAIVRMMHISTTVGPRYNSGTAATYSIVQNLTHAFTMQEASDCHQLKACITWRLKYNQIRIITMNHWMTDHSQVKLRLVYKMYLLTAVKVLNR